MEETERLKGKFDADWEEVDDFPVPMCVGVWEEGKKGVRFGPLMSELMSDLMFLGTFLEYAAPKCVEYHQDLMPLLMSSHELYFQALMFLIELPIVRSCVSGCVEGENRKMLVEWAGPAADALREVRLMNSEIIQVYRRLRGRFLCSSMSYEELMKFVKSVLMNIEVLLDRCEVYLDDDLMIKLKPLRVKLEFLRNPLMIVTSWRCSSEHEKSLVDLFSRATFEVYNAAYLFHSFFISNISDGDRLDKIDCDMPGRLASNFSALVRKIDLVASLALQFYNPVLQGPSEYLSLPRDSSTYMADTLGVDFIESLLEDVTELLRACSHFTDSLRDQIQILQAGLAFLQSFLAHPPIHDVDFEILISFVSRSKIISYKAGLAVYALFDKEMDEKTTEKVCSLLLNLLEELQSLKAKITGIFVKLIPTLPCPKYPSTDEMGSLDRSLQNLSELLNDKTSSVTRLSLPIEQLLDELQFLRSSLSKIAEKQVKDLWTPIMEVACKAEYIVDSILVGNGPMWSLILWLSKVREEIKSLKADVDNIGDGKVDDSEVHRGEKISEQGSLRTELQELNEVGVGFKDVEERIIEDLVGGSRKLQMVEVAGMAGQGKTHLARRIYNTPIVKYHFDVCAWCYVSPEYNSKSLLNRILSQVPGFTKDKNERRNAQELAETLYKSLKGMRYFLLMDDLWDVEAWDALRRSFPDDNNGSRVMYTSRCKLDLGAFTHHRFLRPLSDDESWQLLQKKVFQGQSCPLELLEVGKRIAIVCNGFPLAVVLAVGILVRIDKKRDEWSKIANSLSSYILKDKDNNGNEIIELSYNHLPDYLKPCFLYSAALVKDGQIEVQELIRLWVAERFVRLTNTRKSLEETAEDYLVDLINRSLLIVAEKRPAGGISKCRIHDLVRGFSLLKAQEENFLWFKSFSSDVKQWQWRVCFHHPREILYSNSCGQHVRSLLCVGDWGLRMIEKVDVSFMCSEFRLLSVLKLGDLWCGGDSFPEEIISLVHLRFLSICGDFEIIPSSIANLQNLETFIVKNDVRTSCSRLWLSDTVWSMIKLRHLEIHDYGILQLPCSEVLRLENLQTIETIYMTPTDDTVKLMQGLGNVKHLKSYLYTISYGAETPNGPGWLRGLATLSKLESLHLQLDYDSSWLEANELSLPSNLKELRISGRFNMPWNRIDTVIGKLENLEVLELCDGAFRGKEWNMNDDDDGGYQFPKLKFLKLNELNIRKWSVVGDHYYYFPRLEKLVVDYCRKLEEIPSSCLGGIPTLKAIQVNGYCLECLRKFVEEIEEEQLDMGNEDFQAVFMNPNSQDEE